MLKKFFIALKNIGPGALVTAAFIGPGTLTTCIKAGVDNKYELLWAVTFATFSAIILQLMVSRISIVTQQGLGTNINNVIEKKSYRYIVIVLIILSIFVGNCAFETGNITGAVIGIQMMFPNLNNISCIILISLVVCILLFIPNYKIIQIILSIIVGFMAVVFIILVFASHPDIKNIYNGISSISFEKSKMMIVMGLIGTTIGPYGLFLHANAALKKWSSTKDVKYSNFDTVLSISLGGVISACIVIVAATSSEFVNDNSIYSVVELSDFLGNTWGVWLKYLMVLGLISASITSAITAPIGAAITAIEIIGDNADFEKYKAKIISAVVVIVAVFFSIRYGNSPVQLILFAQIINALILPLISVFVIICANSKNMGKYKNTTSQNILGIMVLIVCIGISIRNIISVVQSL